jgi:hypothetical protein
LVFSFLGGQRETVPHRLGIYSDEPEEFKVLILGVCRALRVRWDAVGGEGPIQVASALGVEAQLHGRGGYGCKQAGFQVCLEAEEQVESASR